MFTPVWTDTKIAQPSASGDWAPGAYDPQSGYLFFTTGVSTRKFSPTGRVSVPGTREYGLITALDSRTNKQVWQKEVPYLAGFGSGVLATAGGLLFHGGTDGYFRAFDSKTGEELWRFQTGFGADAPAATYEIDGEQYVAIAAGGSRDGLKEARGDLVWSFKIGGRLNPLNGPPAPAADCDHGGASEPGSQQRVIGDGAAMTIRCGLLVFVFTQAMSVSAQDRLPPIPADKMTEAQKKAAADYKDLRKTDLTGPPWTVMLRVPDSVAPAVEMRLHVQARPVLGNKLTEFAILIAAREWTNNYEWNAHSSAADRAGLNAAIIASVADGRRPEHMAEDEEIVYDFCAELQHNKSVSDPTYARALAKFGEAGVVEMANIEGYYVYLSMIMNTARSPVPAGAKPPLAAFPK